jgi:hypothetical protein
MSTLFIFYREIFYIIIYTVFKVKLLNYFIILFGSILNNLNNNFITLRSSIDK